MVLARYQSSKIANCKVWRTVGLAHFPFIWDKRLAIFRYVGKIWDGSGNCEIPDRLGFSRHMKTKL